MLFPLKLKNPFKNELILPWLSSEDEEKKAFVLNHIRIGLVFKTTSIDRYPKSLEYIKSLNRYFINIYDIGCSDGSSSLSFMRNLEYQKYYGLDLNINIEIKKSGDNYFLLDDDGNIHMYENNYLLIYLDPMGLQKSFFEKLITRFYRSTPTQNMESINVELVHPECKRLMNVQFKKFDLFNDEINEKSDLIIIFNLLNKFKESRYTDKVKNFLLDSLNDGGIALIGENEPYEKATVYQKNNKLDIIKRINGGSESTI